MPKTVQMVPVHHVGGNGRGKAELFVTYETAREMVDARLATWGKKAKYICLTVKKAEMSRPARSLTMGLSVMEGCAEGNESDMAMRDAWRFKMPVAA